MPGANVGMINIGEMLGKSMGNKEKKKKMTVKESHEILINDESDKLIEQDKIVKAAKLSTENNGIVFLDEIDKISATTDYSSNIVCSVEKENIFGTQFHPEKSDKMGLKMIDNFINL